MDRQKIVRLLVKEILIGEDTITIRHSIPIPSAPPQNGGSEALNGQNYLLCKGRELPSALKLCAGRTGATLAGKVPDQVIVRMRVKNRYVGHQFHSLRCPHLKARSQSRLAMFRCTLCAESTRP